MTTFHIVRHGKTEWNEQGILQGHTDSPLTKQAIEDTKKRAEELADLKFDQVFSSDLLRAQRTAELLLGQRKLTVKTTSVLRERHLGRFEGRPAKEMDTELHEKIRIMEKMQTHERFAFRLDPELDSDEETAQKVLQFLRELALVFDEQSILIVTHSGVLKALLIKLGFADYSQLPHGSIKNLARIVLDCDGIEFWIKEAEGIEVQNPTNHR